MMKMVLLIMVTFTLFGCAAKKMAIDNADTLITYQVGRDLPLSSAQKNILQKKIKSFLNDLKPLATKIQEDLQKFEPENLETAGPIYQELENAYLVIARDFSKILSHSMSTFDETQQKKYLETQKKKSSKFKKKGPAERVARSKEHLEHFIGKTTEEQQKLLLNYNDYFEERAQGRFERREKLQEKFKDIFTREISPTEKEKLIQEAFVNYQKESLDNNKNREMLNALLPTLNKEQIKHLRKKKEEIIDLLQYFMKKEY